MSAACASNCHARFASSALLLAHRISGSARSDTLPRASTARWDGHRARQSVDVSWPFQHRYIVDPTGHVDDMSLHQTWELANSVSTHLDTSWHLPKEHCFDMQSVRSTRQGNFRDIVHTTRFRRVIAGISRDCSCQTSWKVSWPVMDTIYFENGFGNGQEQRYALGRKGWKGFLPRPPNLLRSGQAPAWVWYSRPFCASPLKWAESCWDVSDLYPTLCCDCL